MKKPNLFKTITVYTTILFIIFTTLFIVVNYIVNYTSYKNEIENIKIKHTKSVKETLKWEVEHFIELIKISKNNFEKNKKLILKKRIDQVHLMMSTIYEKYKDVYTKEEIKNIIITALRKVRFSNNGYYFIIDTNGVKILYDVKKEIEGINSLNFKNKNGVRITKKILEFIKEKEEGYYTYKWYKPTDSTKEFEKISYVKLFKPFNWIISNGVYKDDLDKEIQNEVLNNIEQMKLDKTNSNYIFISKWNGLALTYPAKGKNMYNIQDKNGLYLVQELINKAKNGGGFVQYVMPSLKDERNTLKVSYVQGIPEWEWYVGAGLYIDDIHDQIAIEEEKLHKKLIYISVIIIILAIIVLILFIYLYKNLTKIVKQDFLIFIDFFNSLVYNSNKINLKSLRFKEFEEMGNYANAMLSKKIELEDKIKLWNKVFENTSEAVMICNLNTEIIDVNNAFTTITGYHLEDVKGKKSNIINYKTQEQNNFNTICAKVKRLGSWKGEIKNKRKNGEIYPALFTANVILDENNEILNIVSIFSDITNITESKKKLEYLAHHDSLTNLPNRVLLNDRIIHAITNAKRNGSMLAICFIDLDNFKKVNDNYGHTYGDNILKQTSIRIKKGLREIDTLSRIGGDEFILLLENINNISEINSIINKIQKEFMFEFESEKQNFSLSASIGISLYPKDGANVDELVKNADIAMYNAKENGKNTYKFFSNKMSIDTHKLFDMENDLREAIDKKQFVNFYQPQINLKTKEVIGFEALVRWEHPKKGLIPPIKFIDYSEKNKMIIDIGKYVLQRSCKDLMTLQKEFNFDGRISINVSGVQIEYSDFLSTLQQTIKEFNINPNKIELELTESVIMKNPQQWIELLNAIKSLGIKIAIDDFGTGYSSLSYLRKLPIDKLKIDMAFVSDIPKEEDACAIVDSIINLSENMKMITLAEGIENVEQEKYLKNNRCEEGQGYFYGKPMNFNQTKEWLKNNL